MPGSRSAVVGGSGTLGLDWENRRAARDQICACCALTIHLFHFSAYARTLAAAHVATLLALSAVNLASILMYSLCRRWYLRLRPAFNLAVRLGMVALPAAVLHTAYRADQPVAPGASILRLAWRALLTSRSLVLFVPAYARRMSLLPQLTLSALAFGMAARNVGAICATPLMQHERVQGLFAGLSRLVQMDLLLLLGSPLPAAAPVDKGGVVGCRTAVLFLQLVIGVALPTAVYLAFESEEAAILAADQRQRECEHSWDQRLLLWVHSKKKHLCPPPLLFGTLAIVGASWMLASRL
ncbi:hypothetical protein ABPG77_008019 [Micractinium sp. CCAP 211/92]